MQIQLMENNVRMRSRQEFNFKMFPTLPAEDFVERNRVCSPFHQGNAQTGTHGDTTVNIVLFQTIKKKKSSCLSNGIIKLYIKCTFTDMCVICDNSAVIPL